MEPNRSTERLALGLAEAAARIGVSTKHLRNEIDRGRLAAVRSGRRRLILADELRRYLGGA